MNNIVNIINIMRSSLDLQEILSNICHETGKLFNVQRAIITQLTNTNPSDFIIREEVLFSLKAKGLKELNNINPEYTQIMYDYFAECLLEKTSNMIVSNISKADIPTEIKKMYEAMGVKSFLAVPIMKNEDKWGWLLLAEYNYYREWTKNEIELLETIAYQAYVTINQAELYEKEKKALEKERLTRHIIELTRNSLDINKTKKTIIDVIGQALNADRCFIIEYDKQNDKFQEIIEEYLSLDVLKSYIGVDLNKHVPRFMDAFKSGKSLIFNESMLKIDNKKININDGSFEAEKRAIEEYKVFSAVSVPMFYADEFLGNLVLHYVDKNHNAGEEELDLLKMVSGQLAIAIHQAKLYGLTKKQLTKEIHLSNIINKIRSSLDINDTLNYICQELYTLFDSELSTLIQFTSEDGKPKINYIKEFAGDKNFSGFSFYETDSPLNDFVFSFFSEHSVFAISDIQASDLPDFLKADYKTIGAKSILTAAIKKGDHLWGAMVLTDFTQYRNWSRDEQFLFETLAAQVYIAINQAELYEKEKATAERESLINKIVDKVRQSLDIKEMKKAISSEIGKYLDAERVVIHQFDKEANKYLIIDEDSEYRNSKGIVSFVGVDLEIPELSFFRNLYVKKQELIAPCFSTYIEHLSEVEPEIKKWLFSLNIKSDYVFPVVYQDELVASLYITYDTMSVAHTQEELEKLRLSGNIREV